MNLQLLPGYLQLHLQLPLPLLPLPTPPLHYRYMPQQLLYLLYVFLPLARELLHHLVVNRYYLRLRQLDLLQLGRSLPLGFRAAEVGLLYEVEISRQLQSACFYGYICSW